LFVDKEFQALKLEAKVGIVAVVDHPAEIELRIFPA
jgi:hypothetical protein